MDPGSGYGRPSTRAPSSPALPPLTVERIRDLLAQRREEFNEIRTRIAATERYQEARELMGRVWPEELSGHPDAPYLWRIPHMLTRFQLAHLYDGQPLTPRLGSPAEWEAVRELQDEIAAAVRERDAVYRALERHMRKLEETAGPPAGEDDPHVIRDDDPEAREWLRSGVLASNYFGEHEARAFVERLYAAGAERVVIASDCIEDGEDPPHSDAMRVKLPKDRAPRTAVLKVIRKDTPGFTTDDVRWGVAFLWWD